MLHVYFDFTVITNLSVVGKTISVLPTSISTEKRGSTEIRGKISLIYGKHKTGHLEVQSIQIIVTIFFYFKNSLRLYRGLKYRSIC